MTTEAYFEMDDESRVFAGTVRTARKAHVRRSPQLVHADPTIAAGQTYIQSTESDGPLQYHRFHPGCAAAEGFVIDATA